MQVVVLFNPIAGAGRAAEAARTVRVALAAAGHDAVLMETRLDRPETWLDPALGGADALVVVGGDGAMRLAAPSAGRTDTPVYHYPQGTENLFARELGSDRSVERLVDAVGRFEVKRLDMGEANGQVFLLMASVGYDAEVIHDLSARRRGRISHMTYVAPMFRQLARWDPPRLTITIDGERVVSDEPGCVIVANCRQYAGRLDPAFRASMTDGRLDVVFLPARTRTALFRWMFLCLRQRHVRDERVLYRLGSDIEIACDTPRRFQLDGDPPERPRGRGDGEDAADDPARCVRISLRPNTLPAIMP